jgi:RNA polymerase sigma factor (sigma-70 family)
VLIDPATDPAMAALSRQRRADLVRALAQLPEAHRQVVVCRYLLDLDERETAAALGLARGTVKSRLHRGLAHLATILAAPQTSPEEVERGH